MRPDGTEIEAVIEEGRQPCWSPDGSKLAYIYLGQLNKFQVFSNLPVF